MQIFRLAAARIVIHQIPHVTFVTTSFVTISSSSNFASLFSVMRHNLSVLFHLKLCMLWTTGALQSANFQTFDYSHENQPNFLPFFKPRVSFWLNFASLFSFMAHNSSEISWQKEPIIVQFFRLSVLMKVHPISHAIFEAARSGFIQILHYFSVS